MPIFMSLFSEKDQLMHEGDKATFAKLCLKDKIDSTNNSQDIDILLQLMVDGSYDNANGQKEINGGIS